MIVLAKKHLDRIDARKPGYKAAVLALAASQSDDSYTLAPEAVKAIQKRFGSALPPRPQAPAPSRGVGDTLAKVLDTTGLGPVAKRVIEGVTGKPCGCEKRRAALNALIPYK